MKSRSKSPLLCPAVTSSATTRPWANITTLSATASTVSTTCVDNKTDVNNGGLTATAKMAVVINSPPTQGIVLVEPLSGTELVERFAVFSTGFEDADVPLSYMYGVVTADGDAFPLTSAQATQYAELYLPSSAVAVIVMAFDTYGASTIRQAPVTVITLSQSGIGGVAEMLNQKLTELEGIIAEGNDASAALELAEAIGAAMNNAPVLPTDVDALTTRISSLTPLPSLFSVCEDVRCLSPL